MSANVTKNKLEDKAKQIIQDIAVYNKEKRQLTLIQKKNQWIDVLNICQPENLQKLCLYYNNITYHNMQITPYRKWNYLKILELMHNGIGTKGIQLLIKSDIPILQELVLNQCKVYNSGIKYLSKGNWPKLIKIDVSVNKIGLDGYSAGSQNNWKKLKKFEILINNLDTIGGIQMFIRKPTQYKVLFTIQNKVLKKKMEDLSNTKNQ